MKYIHAFFIGAALLVWVPGISAQGPESFAGTERIDEYRVEIAINPDGSVRMEERIDYDFAELVRHGIFRTIPYVTTNDAGKRFAMGFSRLAITDEEGVPYPFTESREGDDLRWKIGDPDRTISGKHVYSIDYQVSGALTYFPGHDELYWNAVGTSWPVPVARAMVSITLPQDIEPDDFKVTCFTGAAGSRDSNCSARVTGKRTAVVETTGALESFEGLTIVAGFPKGIVAELRPQEVVPFIDTWQGKLVLILVGIGAFLWYIVAPISVIRKWWTSGRDPKPAMGEARAWYSPPQNPQKRKLTPAETGTLVDERADLRDIYASIVDLARRGYLKIIETKKNTFDLEQSKEWAGDREILPFERELLTGLFKSGPRVSIKTLDLTKTLEKVKSMLYESLVHDKFFPTNPNTLRGWYVALSVVSLIIFNPILFLVSLVFGQNMPRKTLFGAEQAAVARSLKNFLVSQDKQLAFQAKNQLMFEKLLAFAVAFGVERIWAERFKDVGLKQPDWYRSATGARFNSIVFADSIGRGMGTSFAASIAAHSSIGHSSGFSGGSSGGGGGGGGGSW